MLAAAMDVLNEREADILTRRRLADEPETLEDLSKVYDVSRERIRQIEVRAFEKLSERMRRARGREGAARGRLIRRLARAAARTASEGARLLRVVRARAARDFGPWRRAMLPDVGSAQGVNAMSYYAGFVGAVPDASEATPTSPMRRDAWERIFKPMGALSTGRVLGRRRAGRGGHVLPDGGEGGAGRDRGVRVDRMAG